MIAAENEDGVWGYVYSNDLEDGVSTPEEALTWMATQMVKIEIRDSFA